MEVWKDIPNYEGIYQASTSGEIRTVDGKITSSKRCEIRHWKSRVLKGRGNNKTTGRRVSLWKNGKCKDWLVARLVAITFLGNPPENYTVNHKDGNRFNNRVENLEWLSLGDNIRHGFETGLYPQKSVCVFDGKNTRKFRSYAELDRFLNRCNGYTSMVLKREGTLKDANGNTYSISKE